MKQISLLILDRDNIKLDNCDNLINLLLVSNPIKIIAGNTKTLRNKSIHQLIDEGWLIFSSGNRKQASDILITTILNHYQYCILETTIITTDLKLAHYILNNPLYEEILRHWYNPLTKGLNSVYRTFSYKKQISI
jgi:hypothetical protein